MFSFIPSWYGKDGSWVRETKPWYRAGEKMEFDDAVNQIKIFQMAGEDVEVILLSCVPDLRCFLHRERIDEVKVWSVFDQIQNIKGNTPRQIHLNDFDWPEEMEWFYTPFVKLGYRNGELYSKNEFSEDGQWIGTVIFERSVPVRNIRIDDRGFVSYIEYCQNGEPSWRFFYDRDGKWQIKEDLKGNYVYVNPAVSHRFDRSTYTNMEELIEEVLGKYLEGRPESVLINAFDEKHNELIRRTADGRKTACSVFSDRTDKLVPSMLENHIREDRLLVTDTEHLADEIRKMFPSFEKKVLNISPYDARLALGKSTEIRALKILFYVDSDVFERYEAALGAIFGYMNENKKTFLTIGIGRNNKNFFAADEMKINVEMLKEKTGAEYRIEEEDNNIAENETEEDAVPRIAIKECRTEKQIIEALSDHRIIVDIDEIPDLYLQIAGISAGVPLILRTESQYVSHKENGWILKSDDEVTEALRYYLNGLANWNQALIWSLRRIGEYTNGNIVDKWKKAMDSQTDGSDTA